LISPNPFAVHHASQGTEPGQDGIDGTDDGNEGDDKEKESQNIVYDEIRNLDEEKSETGSDLAEGLKRKL
jgi:hypothetical protein